MIALKNINKVYEDEKGETVRVFDGFDFEIADREITCILGKSGCGKTTLLNILAGVTDYKGEVTGTDGKVSYIFQDARLLPNLTVAKNLSFVCRDVSREKISETLRLLEIADKADAYPSQLSGGQAQRVAIARAFLYPSRLLLMDEPFSSLDTALKIRLINAFLDAWKTDKRTVLLVTHDLEEAYMLSNRVVLLDDGRIKADVSLSGNPPRRYGEESGEKRELLNMLLKN